MPGPEDQAGVVDSGSDVSGGVGNGQATGTGQVSENFDMAGALDSISDGLGFKVEKSATAPVEPAKELVPPVDGAKAPEQAAPEDEAAKAAKAAEEAAKAAPAGVTAPKTWKPEAAAMWAQVPPAVQAEIARREEDMFRGLEQYKTAATFGQQVNQVLAPYDQLIRSANIQPLELFKGYMQAEYTLARGTQAEKMHLMQTIARDYKLDLSQLTGNRTEADDVYVDPDVAKLQQRIQELESGQAQVQQREAAQQRLTAQAKQAEAAQQVAAFAADPKNVFFDEVADDIVALLAVNRNMPLAEVYDKAVWANPVTRAKAQARLDAEKQAAATTEAKAKAEAALRAKGANVQVQPKAGAATLPLGTMDDTMAETMREIKNRS